MHWTHIVSTSLISDIRMLEKVPDPDRANNPDREMNTNENTISTYDVLCIVQVQVLRSESGEACEENPRSQILVPLVNEPKPVVSISQVILCA
jgi:hypothetical protein